MSPKEQTLEMLRRQITQYLDDRYSHEHEQQCKKILDHSAFDDVRSHPQAKRVSAFVSELLSRISRETYFDVKDRVISLMIVELKGIIDELLSDDEAKELCSFANSPVGSKVLRNLDLFRESFSVGNNVLVAEVVKGWSDPLVTQTIAQYIKQIDAERLAQEQEDEEGDDFFPGVD